MFNVLIQSGGRSSAVSATLHFLIAPFWANSSNGCFTGLFSSGLTTSAFQDDFEARFGISLPILVLISLGVGICGLLCLCVLCPFGCVYQQDIVEFQCLQFITEKSCTRHLGCPKKPTWKDLTGTPLPEPFAALKAFPPCDPFSV